ncbi:MAG: glycosyltransferase [Planctomycetota bacterium]
MENQPLVSAVVPTYNAEKYISNTIQSVLNQTYKKTEIVVVDDGSSDKTLSVLDKYGKSIKIFTQANQGVSAARNKGITESSGELIAFLDADDIWLPHKIERQVKQFLAQPEPGFVYSRVRYCSEKELPRDYDIKPKFFRGFITRDLFCYPFIATSTVMVRSKCLRETGVFDIRNRSNQDYDLWLRLSSKYKADYINEPLVIYNLDTGSISSCRIEMLKWTMSVIEKQLERTPNMFSDFPVKLFGMADNLFVKSVILAVYRIMKNRDTKTARKILKKYLVYYWRKIPLLMLSANK